MENPPVLEFDSERAVKASIAALQRVLAARGGDGTCAAPNAAALTRRGEVWAIAFAGFHTILRDRKGIQFLAPLLANPGETFFAPALMALGCRAEPAVERSRGAEEWSARAGSERHAAERARMAVTQRIRGTLSVLDERHPDLAIHLRRFVRTGTFCRYDHTAAGGLSWTVTL